MLGLKLGSGVQLNLELYRHRIPDLGNRAQLVQRDMELIAIALDGIGNKDQDILVALSKFLSSLRPCIHVFHKYVNVCVCVRVSEGEKQRQIWIRA